MNAAQAVWRLPADLELWLILAYVAGVLIGARIIEALAKSHFARARRQAEYGFEYVEPRDHYQCLGGATLTLDTIHAAEKMAIYRAPVEHCGGCHLKERCTPQEESRRIYRSLATWAETDVGRFHQSVSALLFVVAGVLSAAGLWHWRGERGTGYLAVALAGSLACLLLQSRRMKRTRQMASAVSEVPSPSA
jgi:hypothetical protein